MRVLTGNLLILIFLGVFTVFFMETVQEFYEVRSLNELLDEKLEFKNIHLSQNSYMLDSNKIVISDIYYSENRQNLDYEEIPQVVIDAVLAENLI